MTRMMRMTRRRMMRMTTMRMMRRRKMSWSCRDRGHGRVRGLRGAHCC